MVASCDGPTSTLVTLAISRPEHISAGDIGNVHAINACRMGTAPPPPGFSSVVDPCPSVVLFFVLVFSGEDHLRVYSTDCLQLDCDGMTAHTKTLGRSPRGAQTELDTKPWVKIPRTLQAFMIQPESVY